MSGGHLLPINVTKAKLDHELENWKRNDTSYRRRGWMLLRRDGLLVDVAFLAALRFSSAPTPLPVISVCASFDFTNYDLWPPSVTFVDFYSGEATLPHVRALTVTPEGPRDLLVNGHPDTGLPFLCIPGTREYHSHPQHTGDPWLLHRPRGEGSLATLCDRIWRTMARNVLGVRFTAQTLPQPFNTGIDLRLSQGDVDALAAQVSAMHTPLEMPKEVTEH